uniref:Uncharacterized protein n=1 Tax=Lygus hesperus TaxID=30085 RepID=A0A146M4X4_LYGHE
MESEDGERSMERAEYNRMSDCFSVEGDSCDAFSMKSYSPYRVDSRTGKSSGYTAKVELWKDALISRNMDLVNCCLQAVLGDLPSSQRSYIGKLMTTVLKEVEDITVGKVEIPARSIFSTLGSSTEGVDDEKAMLNKGAIIEPKDESRLIRIPVRYRYSKPRNRGDKSTKLSKPFVCPGCGRFVEDKPYCPHCNNFIVRLERDIQNGAPPPSCKHKYYRGAPKCRNCRYHKYNDLWRFKNKSPTNTQKEADMEVECLGCQTPLSEGSTRCSSCFSLVRKILKARSQGTPMPSCNHLNYSGCPDCESCRLNRFLKKKNLPLGCYKCGSCLRICKTEKCLPCFNFGTSLEEAYRTESIPECLMHQNGKGAPSCINCRYRLWKEGKMTPVDESSEKQKENQDSRQEEAVELKEEVFLTQEEVFDIKPDLKRIKMEMGNTFEFEMA